MRWRMRPSKPQAVFTALVGVAIIVFGVTTVHGNTAFMILWCAVGVGIIGMNLWAAFSPRGGLYRVDEDLDDRERWRR
jgi:hypothetical protein